MIAAPVLLKALQRLEKDLEDDLRTRVTPDAATSPQEQEVATELDAKLRVQYREARDAGRTGQAFEVWRDEFLTQVAVAWILGCVFVRFMEDNGLVETPRLSGPGERRQRALDQHELYFKDPERRTHSDREYLLDVFEQTQKLPAARELFDAKHNPLWAVGLSGDGATKLLQFWQRLDPETGALDHDFTDPDWNTRFLGDLYQDLSESARKKYALLQTPEFVEEFILDRTLTPAIEEFGFQEVRLIDPACGSGHFLLGAFHRLFDLWVKHEPGANSRELVQRALDQVYGVDLNPFAVAIAKFRLLIEALTACDVERVSDSPAFRLNLAVGDSLLHGPRPGETASRQQYLDPSDDPLGHVYDTEDADKLRRILGQRYQVVVGNPPYITQRDKVVRQAYRDRFGSCHGKYTLSVPFTERFFDLAIEPSQEAARASAGSVGMITEYAIVKREKGRVLIEKFFPQWDLTYVVDTSRAHIPEHGTPTLILIGRHRRPISPTIRAVMGIRAEETKPKDAARGLVWSAIVDQIDHPGSESQYVSVSDVPRERFYRHPWSLTGGGAVELKEHIESASSGTLGQEVMSIGPGVIFGEEDAFLAPFGSPRFDSATDLPRRPVVEGEGIRDWEIDSELEALLPYDGDINLHPSATFKRVVWPFRCSLWNRADFSKKTYKQVGRTPWEYHQIPIDRNRRRMGIGFAFVGTHNHFSLSRVPRLFKQTAPFIALPPATGELEHLALLGILNCSTACFWMKQVFHNKGGGGIGGGLATEAWEQFYEFDGTKMQSVPLPSDRPLELASRLDELAREHANTLPASLVDRDTPSAELFQSAKARAQQIRHHMIALQEELDWRCYCLFDLIEDDLYSTKLDVPDVRLGERAFEIVLARRVFAGDVRTVWFDRHNSEPVTEIPARWPPEYRALVQRRIEAIEKHSNVSLVEQPEYKRRWNDEPWESQQQRAIAFWMLDQIESVASWSDHSLMSTAQLADRLRQDERILQAVELLAGHPDFDFARVIEEIVEGESAPLLPAQRFRASGLRKHAQWKRTWELQRYEDELEELAELSGSNRDHHPSQRAAKLKSNEAGEILPPPRYTAADFQKGSYRRMRGKLDVPNERFVSFPDCERDSDSSLVVGVASWDPLQKAQAIAAYYLEMKDQEGWHAGRLTPLLLALLEMLPWVKQWHNDLDPQSQVRMGDYFEDFINEEARALGLTIEQIESWTPPKKTRTAKPRKKAARKKTETEAKPA